MLKEQYLGYLESIYEDVRVYDKKSIYKSHDEEKNPEAIYHEEIVPVRKYFNILLEEGYKDIEKRTVDYYGRPFAKEEIYKQYRIKHNKVNIKLTRERL